MSAAPPLSANARFDLATREKFVKLPDMTRAVGGGNTVTVQIPKTALLGRIYLNIRGAITSGGLSALNALGKSSIIGHVRLVANSGIVLFDCTGPGYHYLLRQVNEVGADTIPQSDARSAVATGAFVLDMVIPVCLNLRDALGLVMLQSEQTILTLSIDFPIDSTIATGITTCTCTISPTLELFTVPQNQADWPNLATLHQTLEDNQAVAGAGELAYQWPRGNRYLQVLHGLGMGVAPADGFSGVALRVNQSDYIAPNMEPMRLDIIRAFRGFQQRLVGTILWDLMGSSGLGVYDKTRDTIDSARLTDLATVIQATGAGTLYTVRRQLVQLGAAA